MMGYVRAMPCWGCCGRQGVNALEPVLQNAPRQTDRQNYSRVAAVEGVLEHSAPADGGLEHCY